MWSADEGTGEEKQPQRAGLGVLHPGGDLPAAGSQGTVAALLCQRGWCPHLSDRGQEDEGPGLQEGLPGSVLLRAQGRAPRAGHRAEARQGPGHTRPEAVEGRAAAQGLQGGDRQGLLGLLGCD